MFAFLKTISKVFVALAIISTMLLIPVLVYLHDYQLEFSLDKHPIVTICVVGLLILQPITFAILAAATRALEKNLFDHDLEIHQKMQKL